LKRLEETMGADFLPELIDTFLADSEALLTDLQRALAEGDANRLRRAAHTLKSQGASLGTTLLADLCRTLEGMGSDGAIAQGAPEAAELVEQVAAERARVKEALEAILQGGK
jgi:HPt (histidine-containing phosphotransfer) domain-containing protein